MLKQMLSLALVALPFGVAGPRPVDADSKAEKQARLAEEVKKGRSWRCW